MAGKYLGPHGDIAKGDKRVADLGTKVACLLTTRCFACFANSLLEGRLVVADAMSGPHHVLGVASTGSGSREL
eukprot:3614950-Amphidinium_carterae.1